MSVTYTDIVFRSGNRSRRGYAVMCDEKECWEAVTGGIYGLPLSGVRQARDVAALGGWQVWPDLEKDGKDYCPRHKVQDPDEEEEEEAHDA